MGVCVRGVKRPGLEADHFHSHKVPRLRMCGAIPTFPHASSWRGQGQLYLQLKFYYPPSAHSFPSVRNPLQLMIRQIQDIVCSSVLLQIRFHRLLFQNFDHHPSTSQWCIHIYMPMTSTVLSAVIFSLPLPLVPKL